MKPLEASSRLPGGSELPAAPGFLPEAYWSTSPAAAPGISQSPELSYCSTRPAAAPGLLQHQACCSTRPLRVKSKSYWSTSPAAVRSQSCCSTSPAAAPGLPHSGSSRPLAWVPSRERPGASCGHPGAGSRHQAPGTRQQAGGREVEENAEAKLKAIFHTNRCENHCTVLLFC